MRKLAAVVLCLALGSPSGLVAQTGKDTRRIERVKKGAEAKGGAGDRWALVVGVDQYQTREIESLSGAVADAKAIRDVLIKFAEFPESQVILLVSDGAVKPTRTDIMLKLEEIKGAAKPGDLLLFFFAGHGVQVDGQRYMLTYDARISSPAVIKSTALPASNLMQELEAIRVAHRIIMIDACRNDPTKPGKQANVADEAFEAAFTLQPASEGGVRATFLSSSKGQSAYEWTEKRRGFFSYFIEKGLSGEAAYKNKVTVTSLLSYLNEEVPQKVREQKNQLQVPYARVEGSELILVKADKLPAATPSFDKQPAAAATRTIYGVVKDSGGVPLPGASITVALARSARAAGGKADPELKVSTDEDGFFKVDGVAPDVEAKVVASKANYVSKTLTSSPAEAGKKLVVFLPRAEGAKPVAMASNTNPPPPPPPSAPPKTTPAAPAAPAAKPGSGAAASGEKPPATAPRPAPGSKAQPAGPKTPPTSERSTVQPTPQLPAQPPPPPASSPQSGATELSLVAYRSFLAEDFKEAESSARQALQADAGNALANAVLGNAMAAIGANTGDAQKTAASRDFIKKSLARDPNQAVAHNALALTLMAEGKHAEAVPELQKAIMSEPRLAAAHANLAFVLRLQNKLDEAEREYREAIRLEPESAVPYNGLSAVLFSMGKHKDAVKACREAISRYQLRDRFLGLFYVQLAVAQFQAGRQEEAVEAVGRAKALGVAEHDAYATIEKGKPAKKKG
jgi:Tfp pilus assembly protein PilF